jgi:hypothetical protein
VGLGHAGPGVLGALAPATRQGQLHGAGCCVPRGLRAVGPEPERLEQAERRAAEGLELHGATVCCARLQASKLAGSGGARRASAAGARPAACDAVYVASPLPLVPACPPAKRLHKKPWPTGQPGKRSRARLLDRRRTPAIGASRRSRTQHAHAARAQTASPLRQAPPRRHTHHPINPTSQRLGSSGPAARVPPLLPSPRRPSSLTKAAAGALARARDMETPAASSSVAPPLVARLAGHTSSACCLSLSRDGALLASGGEVGARHCTAARSRAAPRGCARGPTRSPRACLLRTTLRCSASPPLHPPQDGRVCIHDLASRQLAQTAALGSGEATTALAWDPSRPHTLCARRGAPPPPPLPPLPRSLLVEPPPLAPLPSPQRAPPAAAPAAAATRRTRACFSRWTCGS